MPATETGPSGGLARGGTGHTPLPSTPSSSRLVANTWRRGHARSRSWARRAQASTRYSQWSRISSARWRRSAAESVERRGPGPESATSSVAATAGATAAGSVVAARSTSQTPSGKAPVAWRATSTASRVLPQPPGPTSVTRRDARTRSATSPTSACRPTKLEIGAGRLVGTSWVAAPSSPGATAPRRGEAPFSSGTAAASEAAVGRAGAGSPSPWLVLKRAAMASSARPWAR